MSSRFERMFYIEPILQPRLPAQGETSGPPVSAEELKRVEVEREERRQIEKEADKLFPLDLDFDFEDITVDSRGLTINFKRQPPTEKSKSAENDQPVE